uniref:Uncharacterized protein n=1 Tax=Papio anubis TaxID=9555 RepID=A0A8I5R1T6_PAPAN
IALWISWDICAFWFEIIFTFAFIYLTKAYQSLNILRIISMNSLKNINCNCLYHAKIFSNPYNRKQESKLCVCVHVCVCVCLLVFSLIPSLY